jgi:hypothetical protein
MRSEIVIVKISDNSYHITAHRALFLIAHFGIARIKESVATLNPQNKPVRILRIDDHVIQSVCDPKQKVSRFDVNRKLFRVEIIPDDQVRAKERDLLRSSRWRLTALATSGRAVSPSAHSVRGMRLSRE